jgi:transposase
VLVNPSFTSQTCPTCDTVDRDSRVTRSLWICKACGYTAHADVAAARNILRRALTRGLVPGAAGGTPVAARLDYDPRNRQLFAVGAEPRSNEARKREEEQSKRVRGAA